MTSRAQTRWLWFSVGYLTHLLIRALIEAAS